MYVVIFRAVLKSDLSDAEREEYADTAKRLRLLALRDYDCLDFVSTCEQGSEIALSYWDSLAAIQAWKNNPTHLAAQSKGRAGWYQSYHVEIVEVQKKIQF